MALRGTVEFPISDKEEDDWEDGEKCDKEEVKGSSKKKAAGKRTSLVCIIFWFMRCPTMEFNFASIISLLVVAILILASGYS